MTGTDLAKQVVDSGAVAKISSANLPATISNGIVDLLTAFAAAQQEEADRKRLLRIYGEAVAGFDPAVAEYALRWLKLHNPRNPFRPTPQDVYEACEAALKNWRTRISAYFTSPGDGFWQDDGYSRMLKQCGLEWGPAPFTAGCFIPDRLVKQLLRERLSYRSGLDLPKLGRDRLARIPVDCFMNGQLESAWAEIGKEEQRQNEIAAHNAYLESLDPDLRRHRRKVLNMDENHKIGEAALMELAQASLARERAEAERRKIEAEDDRKRIAANAKPEVQAAIERLQRARNNSTEWGAALRDYLALLTKEGAKPPPHLAILGTGTETRQ